MYELYTGFTECPMETCNFWEILSKIQQFSTSYPKQGHIILRSHFKKENRSTVVSSQNQETKMLHISKLPKFTY